MLLREYLGYNLKSIENIHLVDFPGAAHVWFGISSVATRHVIPVTAQHFVASLTARHF